MIEPRRSFDASPRRTGALSWLAESVRRSEKSLRNMAIFRIAEQLGKLSVLVAIVFYFSEADERRRSRQAEAWQVIQAASGAGKLPFIEALHDEQGSLAGIDLRGVEGDTLTLVAADLRGARLDGIAIATADFHGANLTRASLAGARLKKANLTSARLSHADLSSSDLQWANLTGTDLSDTDLRGANLFGADLSGANLSRAKVDAQTNLGGCTFRAAALCAIDLRPANIASANFEGAICFMLIVTPQQGVSLRHIDRIPNTPSAAALARAKLAGGSDTNGALQFQVPDHQLCYDPASFMQMTIADFANLTQQSGLVERPGLTVLDRIDSSPLAAVLSDARQTFVAERALAQERPLSR